MRSLFFFWLTFLLASISHLSLADFDPFQILALQADDAVTTTPTPEPVVDDPSLALGIGAQDDSVRIPVDSAETNQQQQGFLEANTSKCPPSNSGAKRRRRDDLNYCRNEDAPTIRPAPSQQGQKVPPSGNLGGQSKPGNNPLATPEEARPEWAPSFSEFFVRDPCEKRPYQVCAPYMPGRDFEEWTSTARALPSFNLPACDFYNPIKSSCTPALPDVAGLFCCQSVAPGDINNRLYPHSGQNCIQKGISKVAF